MNLQQRDLWAAMGLFAASLLWRVAILAPYPAFEGLYGQDPFAYYDFAQELRLAVGEGRMPGPFFWPLGYPALLGLGFVLFGTAAGVGQGINLLLGALLPPLVYVLARRSGCGRPGAWLAAGVMAVCGQAVQSSLVIMADVPALAWATLGAVVLSLYLEEQRGGLLALSVALLTLAVLTRWLCLALALPWGLAVFLAWRGRIRWRDGLLAGMTALLLLLPQVAHSSASPYPTLNHAWVRGWSPGNALRREFTNPDGHFVYEQINALFYARPFYDPYYLAPVFSPFLLLGLVALWHQRNAPRALMLAGWVALPYCFLAGIPYQNIRFPLLVFPAVAVLAGLGLERALAWLPGRWSLRHGKGWWVGRVALVVAILSGMGMMAVVGRAVSGDFVARQLEDRAVAVWATERVPPEANLYTSGLTLTLRHYTSLEVYELYYETPATLTARWVPGRVDFLLVNEWQIETQWAGREPQAAFHWLRDARGLTRLDRFGQYTLFQVGE